MSNIFIILTLISFVTFGVYAIFALIQFVKKDKEKGKKQIKIAGISFGIMIASFIGVGVTIDGIETETTNQQKIEQKETVVAPSVDEVTHYKTAVLPQIESTMKEYDRIWNDLWVPAFGGVSDGTMDIYTAYKQMTFIETNYTVLIDKINKINSDGMSDENKEHIEGYKDGMIGASESRVLASKLAAKMFDKGEFKPSKLDEIKIIVSSGDDKMMDAAIDKTILDSNLGLIETTE